MSDDTTTDDTQEEEVEETSEETPDYEARIKELEAENEKLKDKEMNFEKLRNKEKETKAQAKKKETQLEILKREQEEKLTEIEDQNRKWREDQFSDQKEEFFKNMCGEDKELREKIEYEMEQLRGETNTLPQLKAKMEKAHLLVRGSKPEPSVFGRMATSSAPESTKKKSFADSAEGLAALNKITKGQVDWSKQPKKTSYFD